MTKTFDKKKVLTIVIDPKGMFGESMCIHHMFVGQMADRLSDDVFKNQFVQRLISDNAMKIVSNLAYITVNVEDWSDVDG